MLKSQALAWVRKNCKFAIDLTQAPSNWESDDSAMRRSLELQNKQQQPKIVYPPDEILKKFHESLDTLQVVKDETKEIEDEAYQQLPGGFSSPNYRMVKVYSLIGKIILAGSLYYPDSLTSAYGPIEKIVTEFWEYYPKSLNAIVSPFIKTGDDESKFKFLSINRNGDFYDVQIEGDINIQYNPERPMDD